MSTSKRPSVLIVNDDPSSLLALSGLLSQWADEIGYTIVTANSGKTALREVLLREFAVILLDVNMPEMDGFETAAAIQSRPRSAGIPIIFITAFMADEVSKLNAYRHQAADFLFSPIIPQVLRAKIAIFVALAAKTEQLSLQTEALTRQSNAIADANAKLVVEIREREVAEHSNRAKDDFLAMLSHELRNPLAAIKNAGSILQMPGISKEAAARAQVIIARQTANLRDIANEIMELSRALSGKIKLNLRRVNLSEVVTGYLDALVDSGRSGNHQITVRAASAWIDGDVERLNQIVGHLVKNAFKYTPAGGSVVICVEAGPVDAVLTVKDTGAGIAPETLPRIFDIFFQASVSLDRSLGGLGIGLSMVHSLVALHGGTVSAHSDGIGQGSTFTVRIPVVGQLSNTSQSHVGPTGAHTDDIIVSR
jgi:signal transduction histidine kinase